jgi:hypothetical protein
VRARGFVGVEEAGGGAGFWFGDGGHGRVIEGSTDRNETDS